MKKIVVSVLLIALAACASKKNESSNIVVEKTTDKVEKSIDTKESEDDFVVQKTPTERVKYNETETVLTDLIHTKLEVNFDWEHSKMSGVATITAKPHFYASSELILDAKSMLINSVSMKGKTLQYNYEDDFLTINLGKEFSRNEKHTVVIDYVAQPEEVQEGTGSAITSDKGLYFINPTGNDKNKMPQIWTQGETESSSVWFPTIDSPNAKTSQEIFITVDDKYATLSNGKLMSSKKIADGKRVDHWKQELSHAPYLFMMAIGEFKIIKDSYTRQDGSKMEVNYYVEPEWETSAKDIFGDTPEMIKFFSEKMGVEYPWDKYHQIVVRDYVSGAMENTGAVIFGDFVYKNKRELLDSDDNSTIAHELFHHWFGDLVTAESWSNLTLNESFANYSQYLWDEHKYGIDQADFNAIGERKGYYQSAQMQGFHNLVWFDYDQKDQMFDGHSYNKGGRILHMLRNYLGDDAFFTALNLYLEENKFKAAEFHQLRLAFEQVSGEDLNWFFNQWYLGSGHPTLKFEQTDDESAHTITVAVKQTQNLDEFPIFKLPVQMAIFDDEGKHTHKVVIDKVEQEFTFSYKGTLKGILYDDQQMLLAKKMEDKTLEQYIYQFYHGEKFEARKIGLEKGSRDRGDAGQTMILDALSDPFWNIRLTAISKFSKLKNDKKTQGQQKIMDMASNDPKSAVRSGALKKLKKFLSEDELEPIYKDRIENDQSYLVVSTALKAYGAINEAAALTIAESLENEKSSSMLGGIAQLYSTSKDASKFAFFEKAFNGNVIQGFDKLGLLNSMTVYLTKQEPSVIAQSIPIYKNLSESGGMYMQMFLPQNISYLSDFIDGRILSLGDELIDQEENDKVAYAADTRKKIKEFEAVKKQFDTMDE
ncbi:MAG: M1 family peptidase [Fluviicola sp.]|nr:M1 family peptidase [Fluviicola sp.]